MGEKSLKNEFANYVSLLWSYFVSTYLYLYLTVSLYKYIYLLVLYIWGGQNQIYNCEYTKQSLFMFLYYYLFTNYCIICPLLTVIILYPY